MLGIHHACVRVCRVKGDKLFFASEGSGVLPKVVALSPSLRLGALTGSLEDYKVGAGQLRRCVC